MPRLNPLARTLCLSFSIALALGLTAHAHAQSLKLTNFQLVDVEQGRLVQGKQLLIEDGRIVRVAQANEPLGADHTQDLGGQYLLPSLWDMHVHFEGRELVEDNALLLPLYLAYGITAVREAASDLAPEVMVWRQQIADGERLGPRIFSAGQKFEGIDSLWSGDMEVGDEAAMGRGMEKLTAMKVDFIKITENTMAPALYLKTVAEAHRRGFRVSSHIPYGVSVADAARAGLSSIEHVSYVLRLGHADEAVISASVRDGSVPAKEAAARYRQGFQQQVATEGYKMLATEGVAVTPTLIGGYQLAHLDTNNHSQDAFLRYLTTAFTDKYRWRIERMGEQTAEQWQARKQRYEAEASQLRHLEAAGVMLLAGSDSAALNTYVYPAEGLHTELQLWQKAGLSPARILRAATLDGAKFMGLDKDYGSIAEGKRADLLVLKANPLVDISATLKIHSLVQGGEYHNEAELARWKDNAAAAVQILNTGRKDI
ncbi:amidohydrolase family protein [Shewanella amazonensis]|uniref:Amidohydrolase n=1 Tax=Shewanella amazonensis (strain ATCC BAA-1098 / SB2B) TaxID=326297 RepID=A1S907_SHEAM|nr:amidohydrolase family protein [Shewanella amazonensis]ABM00864.1 amidohydrolase [Shewanella amazonensis SB2B]